MMRNITNMPLPTIRFSSSTELPVCTSIVCDYYYYYYYYYHYHHHYYHYHYYRYHHDYYHYY